ncbi:MAG: hypothetical protein KBT01_10220, partial [Clostridiales bacterium]|nr:hypothetical protein [Candidatus Blautia equi]
DYESLLVRLQWLIVQYQVVRYILFLDAQSHDSLTIEHIKKRISDIFRVTDLPDILKIAFFDFSFRNWLWTPEHVRDLLKS